MKRIAPLFILLCLCGIQLQSQINYTAQTVVPPYDGKFLFGTNLGYYSPWLDHQLADIAAGNPAIGVKGVGINSIRPTLPHHFLEQWGYHIEENDFAHYKDLGIINNTVFVGYPSNEKRDWTEYCPGQPSQMFQNIYSPIWDNGENGTPVNDENPYALYLWKTVTRYGDNVKFWEIWNEPDLDHGGNAWRPAGDPASWWENNPPPCEYKLKAPIFHYVRLLRISYEIIKTVDPNDYVAIGGIGYPAFLDAVLRNTDNPDGGGVTADYPLDGGAYFDCMSFHSYPHIDGSMREWNNDLGDFDFFRHSDAGVDGVLRLKGEFDNVLSRYGYNGQTYPKKVYIMTETNIPRKQFERYIGSDEAQRNYLMKTAITCQQNDIEQMCIYDLGEKKKPWEATNSFDMMGLYESLEVDGPYNQIMTEAGIGYKTTSKLMMDWDFDPHTTDRMGLSGNIRGGAFINDAGESMYVLWAKTTNDRSEYASAIYNLPDQFDFPNLTRYQWNHSVTNAKDTVNTTGIFLSGTPIFLRPNPKPDDPVIIINFQAYLEEASVNLEWVTESEINNNMFVVEHSTDGVTYEVIGQVSGAGTTTEPQHYSLVHDRAERGENFYRLRQVDLDGTENLSNTERVNIDANDIFTIRPTHADKEIHVEFYDYYDKDIEMTVYDLLGHVRLDELLPAGRNFKTIDVSKLDAGHYFIRLKVRGVDYFTRRFIKTKL